MAFERIKQAIKDLKTNPILNEVKLQSVSLLPRFRARAKEFKDRLGGNSREMTASSVADTFQKVRDRLHSKGMAINVPPISGLATISVLLLTSAFKSVESVREEYAETQSHNQQVFENTHPDFTPATVSFLPIDADVKIAPRNC